MKRLLAWLLALALLTGLMPVAALAEGETDNALPQVGQTIHGFTVKEIRALPLVGADVVLFEHDRTGAGLTYIANEDTNRVFDLTFLTRPIDNTGLPHVFEHATLNGSEKYPSSALFFNLSYQTYNTYMNAFTMDALTSYPVASLSEAQLLKYADFYTDSCLHPMILEDESIYREEAWRYRLADAEAPLTIEGTVYSEMLGATTLERKASMEALRAAFPGSVAGNDYGGDPDYIPEMTWEMLKEYHERFYHPSNCMAYLYGQFDHYEDFLALLDEAFAPYERETFTFEDSGYTPLTAPVTAEIPFPMEASSNTDKRAVVTYLFVCPGLKGSAQEELVLNTLTDVLMSDGSPLQQGMRSAYPAAQVSAYISTTTPEDAIVFTAVNMNLGDAEGFQSVVDEALRQVAENGFADDLVESVMANLSLTTRLTTESASVGTDFIPNFAYSYAASGDPFDFANYVDALDEIEHWNREGLYKEAVAKYLIGSETTALTTTYPVAGLKEEKDAALAERLAAVKAEMSAEEIAALVEASNTEQEPKDASEYVRQLQAVTVASLPEEVKTYDIRDEVDESGLRHMDAVAGVDGIGSVSLLVDAAALPREDIHWFKLLTEVIGELPTTAHSLEELDVLTARYLYNLSVRLSLMGKPNTDYHPYLRMGWIATDEDQADAYALMKELVYATDFTDTEELANVISAAKASLKNSLNSGIYNVLLYRAFAVTQPLYRYYSYFSFLEYYDFLEQVEAMMAAQPEVVAQKLAEVQQFFFNRSGAIALFAGNEESIAANRALADAFFAEMDDTAREAVDYDLPAPAAREAVVVDSGAQFNALIADDATLGLEDATGTLNAVTTLVSDKLLIPLLREQYGVYTPLHGSVTDGGVYLLTYRDPNIAETFAVYEQLADLVAGLELDQETLDGYILSAYAGYAMSQGELSGAMSALSAVLNGDPQDQNLIYMRQLKAVTPEQVTASAEMYRALAEKGVRMTGGSAAKIEENAALYDHIFYPFGVTEIAFADVEGSPYADAIAKALNYELMAPVSEEAFGVDEPATALELAAALYAIAADEPAEPEDAFAMLATYGVMGDAQPDTVLTNGQCDQILVSFLTNIFGAQGVEADPVNETTDLTMTRGELAEQLANLLSLFGL